MPEWMKPCHNTRPPLMKGAHFSVHIPADDRILGGPLMGHGRIQTKIMTLIFQSPFFFPRRGVFRLFCRESFDRDDSAPYALFHACGVYGLSTDQKSVCMSMNHDTIDSESR